MKNALLAALAVFATSSACVKSPPHGKARLELTANGVTLDAYTYRPAGFHDGPLLLVLHGVGRNADGYRDYAVPLADQLQALVVAPHFPEKQFPRETYQRGGILRDGKPQPRAQWTFQQVLDLVRQVREQEGRPDMPCYLIGHSAGGQILNRMAAFLPGDARRIIAANPGSLLFPTRDQEYPFGFGGLPPEWSGDEQIKAYLAAPLTLYLGTADVLAKDLDTSAEAMRQGKTRFARGHACFAMAQKLAAERGWPFHWQLIEAPDIGHSAKAMFAHPQAVQAFTITQKEAPKS